MAQETGEQEEGTMDNRNLALERYKCCVGQLRHEAELLWRVCGIFLLPVTALAAFLLSAVFEVGKIRINSMGIISAAVFGLLLCFVWLMSCIRSLEIFDTRKNRVLELEKEFPNWDLYTRRLRGRWRTRYGIYTLVIIFLILYGSILGYNLFVYFYPCIKR